MTTPDDRLDLLIRKYEKGHAAMPATTEETLALELCQFAERFTLDPAFDAALLREFQQPPGAMPDRRQHRIAAARMQVRRILTASAAVMALLVLTVWTIPPLRSFAQDVLRQIGVVTITDAPTGFDVYSTQPTIPPDSTPIPGITPQVYEMRNLSLEQAATLTGFDVLVADYVPPGYALSSRDVWQRNGVNSISTVYYSAATDDSLYIAQTVYDTSDPSQTREFPVGDAAVVDVTVRGVPGVWAEQVSTWPPGAGINMLIWQEGTFTFMMQSSSMPLDEMLKVAESLD